MEFRKQCFIFVFPVVDMFTIFMFFGKMKAFADFRKIVYVLADEGFSRTEMFNALSGWLIL